MKLYGYPKHEDDTVFELQEMTLAATPNELRLIAQYLEKCAGEIEDDPDGWEHGNLSDEPHGDSLGDMDIIVFNPDKL